MALFTSILKLDRPASKALKLSDTYALHKVVYSLFDDIRSAQQKKSSVSSGIQWVDKGEFALERTLLILSNRQPHTSSIQAANGRQYGELETRLLPQHFLGHPHYRFAVVMNPTRRCRQSGKLQPIKGREAIAQWFIASAERNWGFTVNPIHLQVDHIHVQQFTAKQPVTLQQATLTGDLTVTDTDLFTRSISQGIGRQRSFGCGLLQVVPLMEKPFF